MDETPRSLLERLRNQPDAASWNRLVALYRPWLQAWFRHYQLDWADVDDLVQDVLAVVVREMPSFEHNEQRGAFRRWLRTIALNRLKGFWRDRQNKPQVTMSEEAVKLLEQLPDPASDLDGQWEQEHDRFIVQRALELIEPEFTHSTWHAFRRQVIDHASPAEVARELGLTVNAVVLAKFRVMRQLRRELDGLTG